MGVLEAEVARTITQKLNGVEMVMTNTLDELKNEGGFNAARYTVDGKKAITVQEHLTGATRRIAGNLEQNKKVILSPDAHIKTGWVTKKLLIFGVPSTQVFSTRSKKRTLLAV